jgi:glycosyltransferase involved in cell wall biosynthesis
MKIVIVVSLFPPIWLAGIEIASFNIAKYLSRSGHEVHVITTLDEGLPELSKEFGFYVHRITCKKIKLLGSIQFWIKSLPLVMKIRPDIIHIQTILNGVVGLLAKLFWKIPYIVNGHGSDVYLDWPFKKIISKPVLSNANAIIALNKYMEQQLEKMCNNSIYVIPNGIDIKRFNNERKLLKEKTILFVGSLRPVKGVNYLIEAMSIVKNNCNAKLMLVGDGDEKYNLISLVNSLNLCDCVDLIGTVENEKIPGLMSMCSVFVLPSLSEGLPIVVLEAMASGLPIVATKIRGLPELVENGINGFLVEPEKPEKLAEKILLLLMDNELNLKISEANRFRAKQYDWSRVVNRLQEIYVSIVDST